MINGIIEYDQNLTSVLTLYFIQPLSNKKKNWKLIFYCVFAYYAGIVVILLTIVPLRVINFTTISFYFIRFSYVFDVTVLISSYFYLQSLELRFHTLNGFWTQLPDGLTPITAVAGGWTHAEITMLVDRIRQLHAELSDLLRIFSKGFGQMLLWFFVFSYISIVFSLFYIIHFDDDKHGTDIVGILSRMSPYFLFIQNIILIMYIVIAASRVNDTIRITINYNLHLLL